MIRVDTFESAKKSLFSMVDSRRETILVNSFL